LFSEGGAAAPQTRKKAKEKALSIRELCLFFGILVTEVVGHWSGVNVRDS
jgi:hypothetical protein